MKLVKNENELNKENISDKEAQEAFVKILKWMGEDPGREGLLETAKRVVKAFKEYFKGYREDPKEILNKNEKEWLNKYHKTGFKNLKSSMNKVETLELKKACSAI